MFVDVVGHYVNNYALSYVFGFLANSFTSIIFTEIAAEGYGTLEKFKIFQGRIILFIYYCIVLHGMSVALGVLYPSMCSFGPCFPLFSLKIFK